MRTRSGCLPHGKLRPAALKGLRVATLGLVVLATLVAYGAVVVLAWIGQERLLFYPRPVLHPAVAPAGWSLEPLTLAARDGATLRGVLVRPPLSRPSVVLYFGGNAEEVTAFAARAQETYGARAVALVNYRGYGESTGTPGEMALVSDALQLHDAIAARADLDGTRIAVHGRSLGSGVAVQVAAARAVRGVILTSPFASAQSVASEIYPWLPIALLMRHPFDSAVRAPAIRSPALVLVGEDDTLIVPAQSERLASRWGGPVERRRFPGFGHGDLELHPGYAESIRGFLDRYLDDGVRESRP